MRGGILSGSETGSVWIDTERYLEGRCDYLGKEIIPYAVGIQIYTDKTNVTDVISLQPIYLTLANRQDKSRRDAKRIVALVPVDRRKARYDPSRQIQWAKVRKFLIQATLKLLLKDLTFGYRGISIFFP